MSTMLGVCGLSEDRQTDRQTYCLQLIGENKTMYVVCRIQHSSVVKN